MPARNLNWLLFNLQSLLEEAVAFQSLSKFRCRLYRLEVKTHFSKIWLVSKYINKIIITWENLSNSHKCCLMIWKSQILVKMIERWKRISSKSYNINSNNLINHSNNYWIPSMYRIPRSRKRQKTLLSRYQNNTRRIKFV